MAKANKESVVYTGTVTDIGQSGRVTKGSIDVLLYCGRDHLILTIAPKLAERLAKGLTSAAKRVKGGLKDDA